MSPPPVHLRLEAQSTALEFDDGRRVTLPIGPRGLAETVLRHDPPTPAELERAIDFVEDALMGVRLAAADRGGLLIVGAPLSALPGLDARGMGLGRDAVESLFQRLASRALGTPVAAAELPHGRDMAAAVLILRESMHHLGFAEVRVGSRRKNDSP